MARIPVIAFVALLTLTCCTTSNRPASIADHEPPGQREVVDAIHAYREAWNRGDARALASLCHVDCDRIDARGNVYTGRAAIRDHYLRAFATPVPQGAERRLEYEIFSVRFAGPDVAIVDAHYTVHSPPPRPGDTIEGMNTVVLHRIDGVWLRVAHRQRIPSDGIR